MGRRDFKQRSETFGWTDTRPWAADALRLLFHVPRAYAPLVAAWDRRHPGTHAALTRLVDVGLVAYQGPVIVDTRTGQLADAESRKVDRYLTTAKGRRLLDAVAEDIRTFQDHFPHTDERNVKRVVRFLKAFALEDSHARYGLSVPHATELAGLSERSGRWWIRRLEAAQLVRRLPARHADVREVVPAHWRVTRALCRQLGDVVDAFDPAPAAVRAEFRLNRTRFLADIDPARVGISGATDFDHDVETQRVLAALLDSPRCLPEGIFTVEPRFAVPVDTTTTPWEFSPSGTDTVYYQPDAELRERDADGTRLSVVEYERYQTRRDGWAHIQRFLGWLHTAATPGEQAVLRFVVDSDQRIRSYVQLIEAFADYCLDHPDELPANPVTLAVSSVGRVLSSPDPLDPHRWFRIMLPGGGADTAGRPVLHAPDASPYDEYFSRATPGAA